MAIETEGTGFTDESAMAANACRLMALVATAFHSGGMWVAGSLGGITVTHGALRTGHVFWRFHSLKRVKELSAADIGSTQNQQHSQPRGQ